MDIIINENQNLLINKEIIISKKKGENIYLTLLTNMFEQNLIPKHSIHINTKVSIGATEFYSSFLNYNDQLKNLEKIDLINEQNLIDFSETNFNTKATELYNYFSQKHLILLSPSLSKNLNFQNTFDFFPLLFNFLINLPKNKTNKEVPIIIDNIEQFSLLNLISFETVISNLNKKGYFFISMNSDIKKLDRDNNILYKKHHHFLLFNQDNPNYFFSNFSDAKLDTLKPNQYHYYHKNKLINKKPLTFPYINFGAIYTDNIPTERSIK